MSSDDFTSDIDMSASESIFSDMESSESPSLASATDACPYCHLSLVSIGCNYQEHIQECATSNTSPKSSSSSTFRLIHSIPRYQAQFHGLGLHRRLEMMQSLQRLAQRCISDYSSAEDSPSSPPRKSSPTQDLDRQVFLMLYTPASEEKQKGKKRKSELEPTIPPIRPRLDLTEQKEGPKGSCISPDLPSPTSLDSFSLESLTPLALQKTPTDSSSFFFFDKDLQSTGLKTPTPPAPTPPALKTTPSELKTTSKKFDFSLEHSGFGISSLSPLPSPSSFDSSLSPPKESSGTAFFLTPAQSTTSSSISKSSNSREAQHWLVSRDIPLSSFPAVEEPPVQSSESDSKSHEEVLKYLILQYQVLLARTDAFLRSFPLDSKHAEFAPASTTNPSSGTESFLHATSAIQQLASLSSKRLQESFAQIARLQEKISQQSPMFQAPNTFPKLSDFPQSLLGSNLAKIQEQLKSSLTRNWGFNKISDFGTGRPFQA